MEIEYFSFFLAAQEDCLLSFVQLEVMLIPDWYLEVGGVNFDGGFDVADIVGFGDHFLLLFQQALRCVLYAGVHETSLLVGSQFGKSIQECLIGLLADM